MACFLRRSLTSRGELTFTVLGNIFGMQPQSIVTQPVLSLTKAIKIEDLRTREREVERRFKISSKVFMCLKVPLNFVLLNLPCVFTYPIQFRNQIVIRWFTMSRAKLFACKLVRKLRLHLIWSRFNKLVVCIKQYMGHCRAHFIKKYSISRNKLEHNA